MSPDRGSPGDLPIVDRDAVDPGVDLEDGPAVAGLLLAAGTSSRFGAENKLLEDVDGEAIGRHAARTLVDSRVDPIVVVLGHEARRVRDALEGLPLEFVVNEAYERGQASSVRTGIRAIQERTATDAVVVALGDMPFVDPATVDALVAAYAADAGDALAAAYEGERGNPVLFDARFFEQLTDVEGDVGGRRILLEGDSSALIAVDDPGVRRDVDVPDDLPR